MEKHTITKRRYSKTVESTCFLFESFRPVATSNPYEIQPNLDSPRHQRFSPPVFCSTPKQSRRPPATFSLQRKISQCQLQFTTNTHNKINNKYLIETQLDIDRNQAED